MIQISWVAWHLYYYNLRGGTLNPYNMCRETFLTVLHGVLPTPPKSAVR